jgi:hypothetical protein
VRSFISPSTLVIILSPTLTIRATENSELGEMAEDAKLKKNHMAIVLGIGLGVVLLIVLSLM